jgi:hypothetical protein
MLLVFVWKDQGGLRVKSSSSQLYGVVYEYLIDDASDTCLCVCVIGLGAGCTVLIVCQQDGGAVFFALKCRVRPPKLHPLTLMCVLSVIRRKCMNFKVYYNMVQSEWNMV